MQTFQINFWGDSWQQDENFEYLTIDCKDIDEVIEYLRNNCEKQYNRIMYTNYELSVWQHKNDGNVILWYNIFSPDSNTYDLNTGEEGVKDWKDNFAKNKFDMTPPSERPYTEIKLEDLSPEQFKNLTYLILTILTDDYGGIYLTINHKVNGQFVRYPFNYSEHLEYLHDLP